MNRNQTDGVKKQVAGTAKEVAGKITGNKRAEYEGKAVVGKVDVDTHQQYAAKYGVRNIPTVLVFKNGEIVNRQVGVSPKKVYTDAIDAAL